MLFYLELETTTWLCWIYATQKFTILQCQLIYENNFTLPHDIFLINSVPNQWYFNKKNQAHENGFGELSWPKKKLYPNDSYGPFIVEIWSKRTHFWTQAIFGPGGS